MNGHETISGFLERVRLRLARADASRLAARCLTGLAAAALLWAIGWRIFGYAAPRAGYAVVAVTGLLAWTVGIMLRRRGMRHAAVAADETFDLKDGLLSWLGFRAKDLRGEAFELHERAMAAKVGPLDPAAVPVPRNRRLWTAGFLTIIAAAVLSLIPHSAAVRDRLAREELTSSRSAEVKRQAEEAVEELLKQLDEEERGLVDPAKLRDLARALEETKDPREAEKQIARFEAELAKAMQGLEARQDEAVLKLSAEELAKSQVADARQLGKHLDAKDYQNARGKLDAMKPKAGRKLTEKELAELRKKVAKTKEMAKRMAEGARRRDFGNAMKPGDKMDGAQGAMDGGNQQPLQEMLDGLDADARRMDAMLAEGEFDPDAEEMMAQLGGKLDGLGKRFGMLGARQRAKDKLGRLRAGMCDAREFAQGRTQQLGLARSMSPSPNAGGREAGTGSVESRRDARDELQDNGNLAQLKGQQNADGTSSQSVESADSGTGVAGRAAVDREREFRRQMESLVRRDDIPEELKLGVREYFERIHKMDNN